VAGCWMGANSCPGENNATTYAHVVMTIVADEEKEER